MGFLLSVIFGFAPMLFFAWFVYWLDRYEKEPKLLLGGVFAWGAFVATSAAFVINTVLGMGVYLFTGSEGATELATGSLIAPPVEEVLKGLAVLVVFLLARQEFDSLLDGIVYAAIVALGFAATENTFYIYDLGYQEAGLPGLIGMVFIRVFLVGWQHPFYTAFFGIGLASARLSKKPAVRVFAPLGGLAVGMILHSIHNTLGTLLEGFVGFVVSAMFDWTGWIFMFLFILWAIAREQAYLRQQLRQELQLGLLSPAQYRTACSAWAQSIARFGSLTNGRFSATSRFYQVCGELAHKKQQFTTLGEEGGNSQIVERLRQELKSLAPHAQA